MDSRVHAVLLEILEKMYNHFNKKHDVHYKEGSGAIFVPYGQPISPTNIIANISEHQIMIMSMTGVNITFR